MHPLALGAIKKVSPRPRIRKAVTTDRASNTLTVCGGESVMRDYLLGSPGRPGGAATRAPEITDQPGEAPVRTHMMGENRGTDLDRDAVFLGLMLPDDLILTEFWAIIAATESLCPRQAPPLTRCRQAREPGPTPPLAVSAVSAAARIPAKGRSKALGRERSPPALPCRADEPGLTPAAHPHP